MRDKVTTVDLLDFIAKAQGISPDVKVEKVFGGYGISIYCNWLDDDDFWTKFAFISDKGKSAEFYEFLAELDYQVKLKEEKVNNRQRRQEVLSRLSDEEKELLGVS